MTEHVITLKVFVEKARAGRLTAIRCAECGALAVPAKEFCPACQRRRWEAVSLSGTGRVTSFTVIRIPPRGGAPDAPYAVAVVWLDEGLSMLGHVVEIPVDTIKTGLPVKFRPLMSEGQTVIGFGPAWSGNRRLLPGPSGSRRCTVGSGTRVKRTSLVPASEDARDTQWDNVWPRTVAFSFDLANALVLASPDGALAVAVAPWTSTGSHPDGAPFPRPGRATIVLARQPDGRRLGVHSRMSLGRGVPQDSHGKRRVKAR